MPALVFAFWLPWPLAGWAQADPFVGRFSGEIDGVPYELTLFSDSPGHYDGELRSRTERLPFVGQRFGENLMATIGFSGTSYRVRGRALGAILVLEPESGGRLVFHRQGDD